jgi:hypothetical protein
MFNAKLTKFLIGIIATLTVVVGALAGTKSDEPIVTTTTAPAVQETTTTLGAHAALQEDLAETTTSVADTTTTVPVIVNAALDTPCYEWLGLAVAQGWTNTPEVLEKLGRIIFRESRCIPQIVSKTSDHGLSQINETVHRDYVESVYGEPFEVAMADPAKNLAFAWRLYSGREASGRCGWKPWSVSC